MSNKATCPACDSHTSDIWIWINDPSDPNPSPCCGLSKAAYDEITTIRQSKADEELKERSAELAERCGHLKQENDQLRRAIHEIRYAIDKLQPPKDDDDGPVSTP